MPRIKRKKIDSQNIIFPSLVFALIGLFLILQTARAANGLNVGGDAYVAGNLGIGIDSPTYILHVINGGSAFFSQPLFVGTPTNDGHAATKSYVDSSVAGTNSATTTVGFWTMNGTSIYKNNAGNVGVGTSSPTANLHVVGNAIISSTLTMGNSINMGSNNITSINKLTVSTIDPLYNINGVNYSTFASSIAGGVKEEYVGQIKIENKMVSDIPDTNKNEYEVVIDFDREDEGSDLWVWRKIVDFSRENVQVMMTPYGGFANVYYLIDGNKLILRADKSVMVSYRLVGNRFDWLNWPTRAQDQKEKAGFIID